MVTSTLQAAMLKVEVPPTLSSSLGGSCWPDPAVCTAGCPGLSVYRYCCQFRWSFEKFLVDKQGKPVLRYALLVTPGDLEADIDHLLKGDVIDKDE